jgi:hypothetical protein
MYEYITTWLYWELPRQKNVNLGLKMAPKVWDPKTVEKLPKWKLYVDPVELVGNHRYPPRSRENINALIY